VFDLYEMVDGFDHNWFYRSDEEIKPLADAWEGEPLDPASLESIIWLSFMAGSNNRVPSICRFHTEWLSDEPRDDDYTPYNAMQERFGQEYGWRTDVLEAFEQGGLDAVERLVYRWYMEDN
jgi:hypothetical protein